MNDRETLVDNPDNAIDRVMPWPEVARAVGLSRPQIWRLRRDGKFPAPLRLSTNRVGWKTSSIRAWIDSRAYA